jgi:branched-chain amino acid transport system permease protein
MSTLPRDSILSRHHWRVGEVFWLAAAVACYFTFPEYLALGTSVLVMVLLVLSFDLLLGFSGVLSLGHAVLFGLGAYTAGWLSLAGWSEPISVVLAAGLTGAVLAALTGPFFLRLTGLPLLMVTLAFGALVFELAHKATRITGGDDGLSGIQFAPVLGLFDWGLGGSTSYLYVLAWLVVLFVLMKHGALIGAPVYMLLKHFSSQWNPFYGMLIIGVLLMAVVLLARGGMFGLLQSTLRRMREKHA